MELVWLSVERYIGSSVVASQSVDPLNQQPFWAFSAMHESRQGTEAKMLGMRSLRLIVFPAVMGDKSR